MYYSGIILYRTLGLFLVPFESKVLQRFSIFGHFSNTELIWKSEEMVWNITHKLLVKTYIR
jgi:hypothetical protein